MTEQLQTLRQDLALFFADQRACGFSHCKALFHQSADNDHGRLEIRRHWPIADIDWLTERHSWPTSQASP